MKNSNQNHHEAQPIEIQSKRFGYFPKSFRWRGKRYDIQAIERIWARGFAAWNRAFSLADSTKNRFGKSNKAPRLYFRVRCRDGVFDLYQDLRADTWHLCAMNS